jgi:hypothetical protein
MEKIRKLSSKEILLLSFVMVSVALVFILWFNAFLEKDVENPYFYREIPEQSESFYQTRTAIAEQAILGTGTPTVVSMHKEATPTQTATPVPTLPVTPESDG